LITSILFDIKFLSASANPFKSSYSASTKPTIYSSEAIPSFSQGEFENILVILRIQSLILHCLILMPMWWLWIGRSSFLVELSSMEKMVTSICSWDYLMICIEGEMMKSVKGCIFYWSCGFKIWIILPPKRGIWLCWSDF
jgi:hypothetical protein